METQGGSPATGPTGQPEQEIDTQRPDESEEGAEGQPRNDPTIYHDEVEPTAVGQPTEPPRPDPTSEIRQRYEDNAEGNDPDNPEELAEKRVEARKQAAQERQEAEEEFREQQE